VAQSARSSLAKAFGPAGFAHFENILRRYAVSGNLLRAALEPCMDCPTPTGESSTGQMQMYSGTLGAAFTVTLSGPAGVSFYDRIVREQLSGTIDGCYAAYPQAGLTPVPSSAPGNPWPVDPNNVMIGADYVGLDLYWVNGYTQYLSGVLAASGNPALLPFLTCAVSISQQMQINGNCDLPPSDWQNYQQNDIRWTIWPAYWLFCTQRGSTTVCGGNWNN